MHAGFGEPRGDFSKSLVWFKVRETLREVDGAVLSGQLGHGGEDAGHIANVRKWRLGFGQSREGWKWHPFLWTRVYGLGCVSNKKDIANSPAAALRRRS